MTIFTKIINKELPADIVYEDNEVLVFKDINPKSDVHLLAIPKEYIENAENINEKNSKYIAKIFEIIPKLAKEFNFKGFKVLTNSGAIAGQEVMHLHFHILGYL